MGVHKLEREIWDDTPVTYWPLNDGSGNPNDLVGSDDLTPTGSNVYVTDSSWGNCDVVDSTSSDWEMVTNVGQAAYTFEIWVFLDSLPSGEAAPLADWGGSTANGVMFVYVSPNWRAYHAGNFLSAGALSLTAWHHLVVTWDGVTQRFYIDGAEVANRAEGSAPGTSNGGGKPHVNNYGIRTDSRRVPGRLAHAAMYTTALSAARVLAHYNAGILAMLVDDFNRSVLGPAPNGSTYDQVGPWDLVGDFILQATNPPSTPRSTTVFDATTPTACVATNIYGTSVSTSPTPKGGVVARFVDSDNFICAAFDTSDQKVHLFGRVTGTDTEWAVSADLAKTSDVTISVDCVGNTYTVLCDGVPQISYIDGANNFLTATVHGVVAWDRTISFDWLDVEVNTRTGDTAHLTLHSATVEPPILLSADHLILHSGTVTAPIVLTADHLVLHSSTATATPSPPLPTVSIIQSAYSLIDVLPCQTLTLPAPATAGNLLLLAFFTLNNGVAGIATVKFNAAPAPTPFVDSTAGTTTLRLWSAKGGEKYVEVCSVDPPSTEWCAGVVEIAYEAHIPPYPLNSRTGVAGTAATLNPWTADDPGLVVGTVGAEGAYDPSEPSGWTELNEWLGTGLTAAMAWRAVTAGSQAGEIWGGTVPADTNWFTTTTPFYEIAQRVRAASSYGSNPGGQHPQPGTTEPPETVTPFIPDVNPFPPDPTEIEVPLPPWIPDAGTWREDV